MLANLADLTHDANRALVLGVVLGPVECALLIRRAAVDWCVASRADIELGKLIELNLDRIIWVALALSLGSTGLR